MIDPNGRKPTDPPEPAAVPGSLRPTAEEPRLLKAVRLAYEGVLVALTVAMVSVVVVAVWFRYVMRDPILYSFDLSTLLFAWIVFAGMALARIDGAHLGVDLLAGAPDSVLKRTVLVLRELVVLAISVYLTYLAVRLTLRTGVQITSMRVSAQWLYAAMPVGFALMSGLTAVRLILLMIPGRRVP